MKVKKIMYAPTAVTQFTYRFNRENNTSIEKESVEYLDGSPFVTIDFKETNQDLVFQYSYELGRIQNYLARRGEELLPLDDYPFPPTQE
ncbi:hypothetical protein [Chryseobacterium sp. ERMR1:04]|uniref:hypothetical protein n=1 Tax=Chryseobacterium sp. ERMR1:04 TaxID=1705393 RepID=UPI0006C865AF|nr:hypothetical protein [Chryseobacterium sp. ERMR1:04]KPH14716.1 hypothetical protein AMQ68_04505 [Chryseobacterium sp. ERMR1:04]